MPYSLPGRFLAAILLLHITACHRSFSRHEEPVREQACADHHCRGDDSYSRCQVTEEPLSSPPPGSPLCQWNGSS